ncbi:MAG: hypothetical protein IT342_11975 [Candidatus Melainabacteria bacterium]|nr:hypothetical protein [Candidatus Melainabacteria bacterium]
MPVIHCRVIFVATTLGGTPTIEVQVRWLANNFKMRKQNLHAKNAALYAALPENAQTKTPLGLLRCGV